MKKKDTVGEEGGGGGEGGEGGRGGSQGYIQWDLRMYGEREGEEHR